MRKRSNYDDLLLKSFIRESFIQCKKEDLFETKQNLIRETRKQNLIREARKQNLTKSFNRMCKNIDNILSEKHEKSYSIRNIFLENNNLEVLEEGWLEKFLLPDSKGFASYGYQDDPNSFENTQIIKGVKKMYEKEIEKINASWESILKRAAEHYDNLEKLDNLPKSKFLPQYQDEEGKMQPSPMDKEEAIANLIPPGDKANIDNQGKPFPIETIKSNYFSHKLPSHSRYNTDERGNQKLMDEKEFVNQNKHIYYDEKGQKQQYRLKMGIDKFSDFLNKQEVQQVIMALMLIPMAASKFSVKVPKITMPDGKKVDAQTAAQQLGLEKVVDKDGNFDKEEFKKATGANDKQADETEKELEIMKMEVETQEDLQDLSNLDKAKKAKKAKKVKKVKKAPEPQSEPEPQSNDFSNLPGIDDAPKDTDELFKDLRSLDFKEQMKNAEKDVKNKKDAGASESQSFESGKANQKTFNINKATASKNFKAGKDLSALGGEDNYKEVIKNIKFGESVKGKPKTKTKNRFANKVGEGIGEIIVGAAHSKVEQKYEDDLKKIGDFEVKINSSDRLGDASKVKGQDTTTDKIIQSDAMEQLNKLNQLKDEIRDGVADVIKTGKGTISGAVASALESSGLDEEVKEAVFAELGSSLNLGAIVTHYANDYNPSQGTTNNSVMNQGGGHYQEYGQDTEVMSGNASNFQN